MRYKIWLKIFIKSCLKILLAHKKSSTSKKKLNTVPSYWIDKICKAEICNHAYSKMFTSATTRLYVFSIYWIKQFQMDILASYSYFHCRKKTGDRLVVFNGSYGQCILHCFQSSRLPRDGNSSYLIHCSLN